MENRQELRTPLLRENFRDKEHNDCTTRASSA